MEKTDESNSGYKLLNQYAPGVLKTLEEQFPEHAARFKPEGLPLGSSLRVDASGALAAVGVAIALSGGAMLRAQAILKQLRMWKLISDLCCAISGASLLTVTAAHGPTWTGYVIASVALIGSLSSVFAARFRALGGVNPEKEYGKLAELSFQLLTIHSRLGARIRKSRWDKQTESEVAVLLKEADATCKAVHLSAAALQVSAFTSQQVKELSDSFRSTESGSASDYRFVPSGNS
jgi:hypothetical protein